MVTVRVDARFCTQKCGVYYRRKQGKNTPKTAVFPPEMTQNRRFVRAKGKIPLQISGRNASSTKPATWSSLEEVMASDVGDGYGVMLGGGLGCYDFDNVTDEVARGLAALISEPVVYAERSLSGCGVHVFVEAEEGPGSMKWQGSHERYTGARFIRMTGNRFAL